MGLKYVCSIKSRMLQKIKKREFILIFSILGILLVSGCSSVLSDLGCCGSGDGSSPPPPPPPSTTTTLPGAAGCQNHQGDVNNDGYINSVDAALILQHTGGIINLNNQYSGLSPSSTTRADVNGNGQVGSNDATLVLQYTAGYIDTFMACGNTCDNGINLQSGLCDDSCNADSQCDGLNPGQGNCNNQCEYSADCTGNLIGGEFSTSYYSCGPGECSSGVWPDPGLTTACGTYPTTHRTVANGNLPCGTRIYVDFGQGNPWTGTYVVEDRGSAVGNTHLDIFCDSNLCSYIGDPDNPPTTTGADVYYSNC